MDKALTSRQLVMVMVAMAIAISGWAVLVGGPASAQGDSESGSGLDTSSESEPGSGTRIIDTSQYDTPAELSVAISQEMPDDAVIDEVLIARDDDFADALASGALQGTRPLLLIPGQGELPAIVGDEISRLGVERVVVLGGTAAVSDTVIGDLIRLGLAVDRVAGPDRISTAAEIADRIASDEPVETVILARAYGSSGDPTQAFADALAAGAMGAETGWPILLTDSSTLSSRTRDVIRDGVEDVYIVGGTEAISAAVEAELETLTRVTRVAGPNRFGTAAEIAKVVADRDTVDDADGIAGWTLIEGTEEDAWQAGFAAASVSAATDSPILLGTGEALPVETEAQMSQTEVAAPEDDDTVLLCIISFETCEFGRRGTGLPPSPLIGIRPADGAAVGFGSNVMIGVDPVDLAAGTELLIEGCLAAATPDASGVIELDDSGNAVLQVPRYGERETCDSTLRATFDNGETAVVSRGYVRPAGSVEPDNVDITVIPSVRDDRDTPYPVVLRSTTTCDHDPEGIENVDDLILTGEVPVADADGNPYPPLATWDDMQGQSEVLSDARCTLKLIADSDATFVNRYQVTIGEGDDSTEVFGGTGQTVELDIADASPDQDPITVTYDVLVSSLAIVDTSWPAPEREGVPVWILDRNIRANCFFGQLASTPSKLMAPAGLPCTFLWIDGSDGILVMYLGHPLTLQDGGQIQIERDRGPLGVWGEFSTTG
ncbi:cell wall-binding repeat-containing protein [Euzebya tangerina]|uniref:cell wall-binding repeat-containing protein n=1 Tax=Euzebya tangerina TaxID=591198 RepID=UPI0013C33475|nr:cell wall-binding repeat-containing protein [Euzebya tangerina]